MITKHLGHLALTLFAGALSFAAIACNGDTSDVAADGSISGSTSSLVTGSDGTDQAQGGGAQAALACIDAFDACLQQADTSTCPAQLVDCLPRRPEGVDGPPEPSLDHCDEMLAHHKGAGGEGGCDHMGEGGAGGHRPPPPDGDRPPPPDGDRPPPPDGGMGEGEAPPAGGPKGPPPPDGQRPDGDRPPPPDGAGGADGGRPPHPPRGAMCKAIVVGCFCSGEEAAACGDVLRSCLTEPPHKGGHHHGPPPGGEQGAGGEAS